MSLSRGTPAQEPPNQGRQTGSGQTGGTLLGGRVRYRQFATGHRTGIEPVLLAAAIPARPGQTVLESGTGAGAGLLCLGARVPGVIGIGVERDPTLAALAQANFAANGQSCAAVAADIGCAPLARGLHHGFANPPWHDPAGTPSPSASQDLARRRQDGLTARWTASLAAPLRDGGTLTLILPLHQVPEALAALPACGCGAARLLPLWPRAGRPAKLAILQARRGGRSPFVLLPGLTLHEADGRFTAAAEAILRDGSALSMTVE